MPLRRIHRTNFAAFFVTLGCSITLTLACGGAGCSRAGSNSAPSEPVDASRTDTDGANGDAVLPTTNNGKPDGATTQPPDPGPPAVRFIGRFDTRNAAGPTCAWPGCRIIANFDGTEVKARLDETVEAWMQGGPSEWDVLIDGALKPKIVLDLGSHEYVLASGLPAGPHRVELYKRSESQNGYTRFLGYDFAGGKLLPPPLPATRRIEFVGDSGPAGFGIEGVGQGPDCPGPDWSAHWQNFHKSMGARLAEMFDADLHGTIYSGKGLVRNIYRPDPETMPLIYPRANPIDPTSVFDTSTFVPDVIVLMMGGNDFAIGQPADTGPTPLPEFTQATRELVATFRARAPQAHVFLALSPSVSDASPPGNQSRTNVKTAFDTVATERGAAGDNHVYSVAPPVAAESELIACNGHGTPEYHDRVAKQLAAMIKPKAGW
jgi:lysophospholipase L1-like esterase